MMPPGKTAEKMMLEREAPEPSTSEPGLNREEAWRLSQEQWAPQDDEKMVGVISTNPKP